MHLVYIINTLSNAFVNAKLLFVSEKIKTNFSFTLTGGTYPNNS